MDIEKTPLLEVQSKDADYYYVAVPVSHSELDSLVGRLMQMADLIGDVAQRSALKSTIKQITRDWLDNQYTDSGYDNLTGIQDGVKTVKVDRYKVHVEPVSVTEAQQK